MRVFSYDLPDYVQPVEGATAFHDWLTGVTNATSAAVDWGSLLAHFLNTGSFAELMSAAGETSMAMLPVNAPKDELLEEVRAFRDHLVLQAGLHGDFANFVAWNFFPARHHPPFLLRMAPNQNLFLAGTIDKKAYLTALRPTLDAALESRFAGIEHGSPRYTGQFIASELSLFLDHQGWAWDRVEGTPVSGELFHAFTIRGATKDVMVLHIDAEVTTDPRDLFSVALIDKATAFGKERGFEAVLLLGNTALYVTPPSSGAYTEIGALIWGGISPAVLPAQPVAFADYALALGLMPAVGAQATLQDRGGLMTQLCGIPVGVQIHPARRIHLSGASYYAPVGR